MRGWTPMNHLHQDKTQEDLLFENIQLKAEAERYKGALEKTEIYIRSKQSIPLVDREELQRIIIPAIYA